MKRKREAEIITETLINNGLVDKSQKVLISNAIKEGIKKVRAEKYAEKKATRQKK